MVTLFVMKMVDARSRIHNLSISKGSDSKEKRIRSRKSRQRSMERNVGEREVFDDECWHD